MTSRLSTWTGGTCRPDMAQLVLSTEDPVVQGARLGDRAHYFPAELVLYLDQHVREVGPRVVIDQVPAERRQLFLLPVEARQVGEALIRLAGLALEGGRATRPQDADEFGTEVANHTRARGECLPLKGEGETRVLGAP